MSVQVVVETLSKEELQKLLRYSENAVPVFYGCGRPAGGSRTRW